MIGEISKYGRKAVEQGLTQSRFGNISVRSEDKILIKKSGIEMDEIGVGDVVEAGLDEENSEASVELKAHQEIYKRTDAGAILHVHSPYAVALSLKNNEIVALEGEGKLFLPKISVVEGESGTKELGANVANGLKEGKAVVVRGHGTFAVGKDLKEAFMYAGIVEYSSKVKFLHDSI